jgi:hypothetical protein
VQNFLSRGATGTIEEHRGVVVRLVNTATDLVGRGVDCDEHCVVGEENRIPVKEMIMRPSSYIIVHAERSLCGLDGCPKNTMVRL